MFSIPIVDFSSCVNEDTSDGAKEKMGSKLVSILSETGFVYLSNHGISSSAIDEVNEVTRLFFEAPLELKNNYTSKYRSIFGYVGIQEEVIDPSKYPGYKELFNLSGEFVYSEEDSNLPDDISPNFSVTIKSFMEKCKNLALNILDILAIGLKLEPEYFRKYHSLIHQKGNHTALRTLYYPSLPDDLSTIDTRLAEHSDYGSITLLFQDDTGGLQVQCANGSYVDATPIKGTVLVNVADALQYWTKGKLKSTKHKVDLPSDLQKRKTVRRSIAYFVNPNNDVKIGRDMAGEIQVKGNSNAMPEKSIPFVEYLVGKFSKSYSELQTNECQLPKLLDRINS